MAAGDLSDGLMVKLRTLLDEASAGFWTDAECFSAMSDGQRELINMSLAVYQAQSKADLSTPLPEILRALYASTAGSILAEASAFNIPADFMIDLALSYNHSAASAQKPCFKREYNKSYYAEQNNTYLAGNAIDDYYYKVTSTQVILETASTNNAAAYTLIYIKKPSDMTTDVDPVLPLQFYNAIVQYAFAFLLGKDQRLGESAQEFTKFLQMAKNLLEI